MYKAVFSALAFLLVSCAPPREVTLPAEQPDQHVVAAYHPYWMRDGWTRYDTSLYDEVYFFSVDVDSTGRISERNGWPDRWFTMQRDLGAAGVRVTPVVTLFSQRGFERLFSGSDSSSELMESLLSILRDSPAAGGLQIDFEVYQPVSSEVRTNFTAFVIRLRAAMTALRPNRRLSLYMLAYDESDVYDEAALARAADYLIVQGYDLHGRSEDHTGAVAGLRGDGTRNWEYVVHRFRTLGVPSSKIVMSVPYFGYEWPAVSEAPGARTRGRGVTITYADVDASLLPESRVSALRMAEEHGIRRDPASGSPYYAYEDTSGWRQGWFEDAESLSAKYQYVVDEGLGGVAIFPAAYGNAELEAALRRYFGSAGM